MCVVYAIGGPRYFAFEKAEGNLRTPEGATVFAVCDGKRIEQTFDACVFDAMSDVEYYELQQLLGEVQNCEFIGHGCPYRQGMLSRLWETVRSH